MEFGTRIRTTVHVRRDDGKFLPPSTDGRVLIAVSSNAVRGEFEVEEATERGVEIIKVTAVVLLGDFYEIPVPTK